MKERAPRNRTLTIAPSEEGELMAKTLTLSAFATEHELENRIIYSDVFDCLDYLPEKMIDLLIVDPPYNLDKMFGSKKFSKQKSETYEEWVESEKERDDERYADLCRSLAQR